MKEAPVNSNQIDIAGIMRVFTKRKRLLSAAFAFIFFTGTSITIFMPRKYKADMIIEPGIVGISDEGKAVYADNILNIKHLIDQGAFESEIEKTADVDAGDFELTSRVPLYSNKMKVSVFVPGAVKDKSEAILYALLAEINSAYKDLIDPVKNAVSRRVSNVNKSISLKEQKISLIEERIEILDRRQNYIEDFLKANDPDHSAEGPSPAASDSGLRLELGEISVEKKTSQVLINEIRNEISGLNTDLAELIKHLKIISDARVIKKPEVSERPVSPRIAVNMIISFFLAAAGSCFTVLAADYSEEVLRGKKRDGRGILEK
jgi:hypothetical protein